MFDDVDELLCEGLDEEEWDEMLTLALAQSEETGESFDHIMGRILGGMN